MNGRATVAQLLHQPGRWNRFAMRGVKVAGAAAVIAFCLWALFHDSFAITLVYSMCISLTCWLVIDLGRSLVAWRLPAAARGEASAGGAWPGWAWMLAIVALGGVLGYAAGNELANWITGQRHPGPFNATLREMASVLVLALVPAVVLTYFFQSREVIVAQKTEVETAQRQATEQQLRLLQSQLEPHMLFNTLANLRVLIGVEPRRAQLMLDQLIAFLRASLAGSRQPFHSLEAEFQRLRDYLALMQIRMGPRLEAAFDLPAALGAARVPSLVLQPLVENSIKHGLEPHIAGGRIEIAAAREGASLVLRVRDSGAGPGSALGAGGLDHYGLAHVKERLQTLYGAAASFDLGAGDDAGHGTVATIRLPFFTADSAPAQPSSCTPAP